MARKIISFSLILLLLLLIYQYLFSLVKKNHYVSYEVISNGETFNVDEKYSKEYGVDSYLIKVSNNDYNFIFEIDNTFNKQKNIVENIEVIEKDDYYCIGLDFVGKNKYSYPECIKDNILYSYSSIKNEIDLNDYVSKVVESKQEKYSVESEKKEAFSFMYNIDYVDDNEIIMIYDYKQVILLYPMFSRAFSFTSFDNYKNTHGTLVGRYYVIPRITSLPSYKGLYKYDVEDGIRKEIELPEEISKQSYINGVYDNKLYIFDKSNKKQYEIDPYSDDVRVVGDTEEDGIVIRNGNKESISVYDLDASNVVFTQNEDDYKTIDYDSIYVSDKYAIYSKNGNYYKVYKDFVDTPILWFYEEEAHDVKLRGDNIYYIKGKNLIKVNNYGKIILASKDEFIYNYDNIFDVFIKE